MGPKPTAVDQAGRPPRKLWASSLSFQLNAQAEAINPALFTITITLSVVEWEYDSVCFCLAIVELTALNADTSSHGMEGYSGHGTNPGSWLEGTF